MHYRDGTEAKVGDAIRFQTTKWGQDGSSARVWREGVIFHITPASATCNASVAYAYLGQINGVRLVNISTIIVTLGECDKAELPIQE